MQTLSNQVRSTNPTNPQQAANGNDTVPSQTSTSQPATPPLTQPPVQQKANPIRKTRVTRAAAKAPNPSQEVDPATEGTDEIGSTPVQEPLILESLGEMATTLGAAHIPGNAIGQAQQEDTQSSVGQRTKAKESTMDTLVAKLIQAQEDGQDEAADRYFKLIEMLTTKHQPDPQQQVVAQQQTLAVVPTKRKSAHDETTEVRGLKFVWGVSNDHDEIGFVPYFHKNIMEMRGIIPITIFNRKWQEEALAYHAQYRPKEENSSEKGMTARYTGKPYPEELRQTHSQWTINHACAKVTLKKYGYNTLIEWLAMHVENCEQIQRKNGFMVALRYDVRVRRNAIAFRVESEGNESLSDFSDFKPQTAEEVYAEARNFNELGFGDINPYARGEARHAWNPVTGTDIIQDEPNKPSTTSQTSTTTTRTKEKQPSNPPTLPARPREARSRGGYRGQHYDPDYNRNRNGGNHRNNDQGARGGQSGASGRNEGNGNRSREW
ncbi:hypothetical protein MJO28_017137 [Puccinia striiformis f. sp. tritici]|uniref:Uncharacterized protein n=1 Tax=Puccinia striiformis TaxID=27350 RepID=A0A2S4URH1_9BASI|nr:hypothetical protein MJO28_017137 [Puccinia striiformis f. sp. tritici]POV99821.1 hypothetical protein PSTT_13516 [Puccinia striiformis]